MALTFEQATMLLMLVIASGQFIVLLLLYWNLIVMPQSKRKTMTDKRWL